MAETKKTTNEETATKKENLVEIELFKDNWKYKDDVTVGVNGEFWQIKRGEKVKVPAHVAEVIRNSLAQQKSTSQLISNLEKDYKKLN